MIDQDYSELLNRTPPSGDVLEWTFSSRALASGFASLLVGTPLVCIALYYGFDEENVPRGGSPLRVPTMTRLGMESLSREIFTAGIHLAAMIAIPLFWCVRLAHRQRLQARTGIARYDLQADAAIRWVSHAWTMGCAGAICLFLAASVQGDEKNSWSARGVSHLVLFVLAALGLLGQATCTSWALRKARRVFVVSDGDLASYRRKKFISWLMVASAIAAVVSVLLLERFLDKALGAHHGTGGGPDSRDCDEEWCYSRGALGVWEWVLILEEAAFCIQLRHDLAPATAGVGVESFVL